MARPNLLNAVQVQAKIFNTHALRNLPKKLFHWKILWWRFAIDEVIKEGNSSDYSYKRRLKTLVKKKIDHKGSGVTKRARWVRLYCPLRKQLSLSKTTKRYKIKCYFFCFASFNSCPAIKKNVTTDSLC